MLVREWANESQVQGSFPTSCTSCDVHFARGKCWDSMVGDCHGFLGEDGMQMDARKTKRRKVRFFSQFYLIGYMIYKKTYTYSQYTSFLALTCPKPSRDAPSDFWEMNLNVWWTLISKFKLCHLFTLPTLVVSQNTHGEKQMNPTLSTLWMISFMKVIHQGAKPETLAGLSGMGRGSSADWDAVRWWKRYVFVMYVYIYIHVIFCANTVLIYTMIFHGM